MAENRLSWRTVIDGITTVAILAAAGTVILAMYSRGATQRRAEPRLPTEPIDLAASNVIGVRTSRVAIIVITDFQCPYCRAFATDVLPLIRTKAVDPGKAFVVVRHFPIAQLHPAASKAAAVAECSGRQGQFLPVHDALFKNQKQLSEESIVNIAVGAGADRDLLNECVDAFGAEAVKKDLDWALSLGVSSTPTLFIGTTGLDGRVTLRNAVRGAPSATELLAMIDDAASPRSVLPRVLGIVGIVGLATAAAAVVRLRKMRSQTQVGMN